MDDKYLERRCSFKSMDGRLKLPDLSKAPSSVAGDLNSERGFVIDSYAIKEVNDFDVTPTQKFGNNEEPASFKKNTTQKDMSEVKKAPASVAGNVD